MAEHIDNLKSLISKKNGVARTNLFRIILPAGVNANTDELNLMCSNVNLPGRQILTRERVIGVKGRQLPYGFITEDVNVTFLCLNDYSTRRYFESWQNKILNQETYEIGYPDEYAYDITIMQISPEKTQELNIFSLELPIVDNFLSKFTPDNDFDLDLFGLKSDIVYGCVLMDAYPKGMSAIDLGGDLDGYVQINVQFTYRNWKPVDDVFDLIQANQLTRALRR